MSEENFEPVPEPLPIRPAATVMLIREAGNGVEVFLMRRHAAMEFAAGMTVFPGGGVDDRDREAALVEGGGWYGPDPQWWAQRFDIEPDLAEALVCAAARETFEESGVLFAGPAGDPDTIVADASVYHQARAALEDRSLSFADFLRGENLVLRADLLRPWSNWLTPKEERTRRYDTFFLVGALPTGQRADGDNTESDQSGWATPDSAIDAFTAGRSLLLPPTWSQLHSLVGRTVSDVLAVQRPIRKIEGRMTILADDFEFEFFDGDVYNAARRRAMRAIRGV